MSVNALETLPPATIAAQCETCLDTGYLISSQGKLVPCRRCNRAFVEQIDRLVKASAEARGHLSDFNVDRSDPPVRALTVAQAVALGRQFVALAAEGAPVWVYFWGRPLSGKTRLLGGIFNALLDRDVPALFIREGQLEDRTRTSAATPEQLTKWGESVPVLLLDDFYTTLVPSGALQQRRMDIVKARYDHRLPTVFASRHAPETLDDEVKARLFDRTLALICRLD